jgi:hypothetical protein
MGLSGLQIRSVSAPENRKHPKWWGAWMGFEAVWGRLDPAKSAISGPETSRIGKPDNPISRPT